MSKRFATVTQFFVIICTITALGSHAICVAVGSTVRLRLRRLGGDAGMSTAEYAVGTIAACAFAAVLYQVVTGASIVSALRDLITSALSSLS